ncbi:hypothetical protein [Nannocystis punicea]|uniref:Uncharacterized protein n=1 Tax=Nannocystis punicea TaxID=2995304 RepID=A0ABY7H0X4_9BACT|nr:hypothetical protein [Nannocystis poenicansa]WAS92792.1 hypothetical protein O0S08_41995 [Nannocystis poenicansa]
MFGFIASVVGFGLFVWLANSMLHDGAAEEAAHDRLRASGTKASGTIASVGAGRLRSRQGSLGIYVRPVGLKVALPTGEVRVEVDIAVPETLLHLLIAGAPCEVVIDPANHKHVCITSIGNAFGVHTPVELGSLHSRW